jgi:penicillin-binding protein 1A
VIRVPHSTERFTVNNFNNEYVGVTTLARALTYSDNSVFAQVGIKVGTRRVAALARRMGIRSHLSHNYAMTIGGLKEGVTPLDMAHAYETIAQHGRLTYGSMSTGANDRPNQVAPGPVGVESISRLSGNKTVTLPDGKPAIDQTRTRRVVSSDVADRVAEAMQTVVQSGTATRAQIPGYVVAGKTGTTDNYGDAWFIGWTGHLTVAVWVGYPNRLTSMATDFQGGPVEGGTFPAAIFSTFLESVLPPKPATAPTTPVAPGVPAPSLSATPVPQSTAAPTAAPTTAPAPAPTTAPTTAPAPTATPPPAGGGTGGGTAPAG